MLTRQDPATSLKAGNANTQRSIPVGFRFERALDRYVQVGGLFAGESGDDATEPSHHIRGDFFIKLLGQDFDRHLPGVIGKLLFKQIDLCENLVRKGPVHNPGGMTGRIAQIDQTPFG